MNHWKNCDTSKPEEYEIVETKIDDVSGTSSATRLYRVGAFWYLSENNKKVFYPPTHWREIEQVEESDAPGSGNPGQWR